MSSPGTSDNAGSFDRPDTTAGAAPTVEGAAASAINEDWLAVVVGLALIALVLAGAIPAGLVP